MPISPATNQRIRKDLRTYTHRDEDHGELDELFQYQQTQPYYQWREADKVQGASVIVTNTEAFGDNRSFISRVKGRLVLPEGVHFDKAPKMTLMHGTQQLLWERQELQLELSTEDPNAILFDFINESPDPVAAIHIQELAFGNAHRAPGQSIDMEVSFDSECFEGQSPTPQVKLITTTLLYQRSLGADDSGNGMVALPGNAGMVNITNGNHYVQVPLFGSAGKGISTNLSLHFNQWNAAYRVAIDNMLFHNEDDPNSFSILDQHYHFSSLGYGWNHSFGMLVFPYASPIIEGGETIVKPHAEVLAPDGNRIQFIESEEKGVFEPLYLSDAWEGDANLLLSMRLKRLEAGWLLSGVDLVEYLFDNVGRLIEISTVVTRNSKGSLEPLKIKPLDATGVDNVNIEITDSAGRLTKIESPSFNNIQVTNAASQVFSLFNESKSRRAFVSREGSFGSSPGLNGTLLMNKIEFPEGHSREFIYDRRTCYLSQLTTNRRARVELTHFRAGNASRMPRMPEERQTDFWGYVGKVNFGNRLYEWDYASRNRSRQRLILHVPPPVEEPITVEKHYGYHIATQTVRELASVYPKRKADGSRVAEEVFMGSFDYYVDRQRRATTRLLNIVTATDGNTTNFDYRRSRRFPGSFLLSSKSVSVKEGEVHTHRYRYLIPEEVLHRSIDPNNNITIYQYNPQRLLLSVTYPRLSGVSSRARESWQYHPNGQLDSHRNKRGFFTVFEYEGKAQHNGQNIELDPHKTGLPTGQTDFTQKLTSHQQFNILGLPEKSFEPVTGAWTEQEYDGLNRVKKSLAPVLKKTGEGLPERQITIYEFDTNGTLKTVSDNFGNKSTYAYSFLLELNSTTDVFGNTNEIIKRNKQGAPLQTSDAKGHITTFEYDDHLGRKTKTTSPEPVHVKGERVVQELFYSDDKNRVKTRVGNTNVTKIHDGLGRVVSVQKDQFDSDRKRFYQLVTNIDYPDNGFSTEMTVREFFPGGRNQLVQTGTKKLDEWGREIQSTRGLGERFSETTTIYDFEDNVIETISPVPDQADAEDLNESNRPRQRYEYDSLNRLVSTTDALNVVKVIRQYHDAGTEDGQAAIVEYTHGTETPNQKLRMKPFDSPQFPMVARTLRQLNRLGQVEKTYDFFSINKVQAQSANRLVRNRPSLQDIDLSQLENPIAQQVYDGRGLVIKSIDAEGVTRRYQYNEKGLKKEEQLDTEACRIANILNLKVLDESKEGRDELEALGIKNTDDGPVDFFESGDLFHKQRKDLTHTVSFTYDANDNLAIVKEPSGKLYVKSFDELDRVLTDSHPQQGKLPQVSFNYDAEGRPSGAEYLNGLKMSTQFRDADKARTTQIVHPGFTGGKEQKATIEETFDWDGQLLEKNDSRERLKCTYEYDELRYPEAEIHSEKGGEERYRLEHTYDQLGNRWQMKLLLAGASRIDLTYRYDPNLQLIGIRHKGLEGNNNALSELMAFTYAKSGLPLSAYRSNGVSTHYHFDEIGRLTSALDLKGKSTPQQNLLPVPQQINGTALADQSYLYKSPEKGRKLAQSNVLLSDPGKSGPNLATIQTYDYRRDARLNAKSKTTLGSALFSGRRLNEIDLIPSFASFTTEDNGLQVVLLPKEDDPLTFVTDHGYQEFVFDQAGRQVLQVDGSFDQREVTLEAGEGFRIVDQQIRKINKIQGTEFKDASQQRKVFEFLPPDVVDIRPNAPHFLTVANKDQRLLEEDFRGQVALQRESLLDEQGRVWLQAQHPVDDASQREVLEHGYGYNGQLSSQTQLDDEAKTPLQFRIYDGGSLLAILNEDFKLKEFLINEPGSNVRLANFIGGRLSFTHADMHYQPMMITEQEALGPLVTEPDVEVSTLESIRLNTVDFVVGWGDAFTAGWTTRFNKWAGNDWPVYNQTTHDVAWGLGLAHSLAVGLKGGGAMARSMKGGAAMGWGTGAAAAYTLGMDVDAVAKSSYALATGDFHWSDTLGFLPVLGWGIGSRSSRTATTSNRLTMEFTEESNLFNNRYLNRYFPAGKVSETFEEEALTRLETIFDHVRDTMNVGHYKEVKRGRANLSVKFERMVDHRTNNCAGEVIRLRKVGEGFIPLDFDSMSKFKWNFGYDNLEVWINPRLFMLKGEGAETALRFTIAHEIGHLTQVRSRMFFSPVPFKAEFRADTFAKKYLEKSGIEFNEKVAEKLFENGGIKHFREISKYSEMKKKAGLLLVGSTVAGFGLGSWMFGE